jgi:hypothetical protein
MEDCFCIAVRLVDVAVCFQRLAIVGVVVDLAVVNDLQRPVLIRHRLMPGRDVDDAQTTMTETDAPINKQTSIIRSAMRDYVAHSNKRIAI